MENEDTLFDLMTYVEIERKMQKMTVQDVIDRLMRVEDKSQPFDVTVWGPSDFNLDYDDLEIQELYADSDCIVPSCVSLSMKIIDHGEFKKGEDGEYI